MRWIDGSSSSVFGAFLCKCKTAVALWETSFMAPKFIENTSLHKWWESVRILVIGRKIVQP